MHLSLTRDRFLELAERHTVVPIATEVLGDRSTPVSVFESLVGDHDGFLLESVEGGERWARWSFVGWDPSFTVVSRRGRTEAGGADIELPAGEVRFEAKIGQHRVVLVRASGRQQLRIASRPRWLSIPP